VEPCGRLAGEQTISSVPKSHTDFFSGEKCPPGLKAIVGWGGLVLLNQDVCPVQLMVSYFEQVKAKSCGNCYPCRVGSRVIYDLLCRIAEGEAEVSDIDRIKSLVTDIGNTALCGYGI